MENKEDKYITYNGSKIALKKLMKGLNIDTKTTLKEAFPDPNPFNLDEEQLEQMAKNISNYFLKENKEELDKSMMDQMICGESIIHQKEDGNIRAIDPMSEEGNRIKQQVDSKKEHDEFTLDMLANFAMDIATGKYDNDRRTHCTTGKEGYINFQRTLMKQAGLDEKYINDEVQNLRNTLPNGIYEI